jgi:Zn-finger nucleic acid-binding protein
MNKQEVHRFGNETHVELKYCERCGGLWLRSAGSQRVYCVACAHEMAKLPVRSREIESAATSDEDIWNVEQLVWDGQADEEERESSAAGGAA